MINTAINKDRSRSLCMVASFAFLVGSAAASAKARLTIKFTNAEPTPLSVRAR